MKYSQLSLQRTLRDLKSEIGGVYLCQISVIYLCLGFNFCPYYRGVHYSWVSARRELTVLVKRFILHFFIRTLRGQYVFFYKCTLGLMTVIAMTSMM